MKMDHVHIREASVMVTAQQLSYHRGCAEIMDHIQTLPRNTIRGYGFVYRSPGASHSDSAGSLSLYSSGTFACGIRSIQRFDA
jgi:hypothetical protein